MTDASITCSSIWFLVNSGDPGFITCDDPLQKGVTFFAIISQVAGTNV
jgi:hypothetical protein